MKLFESKIETKAEDEVLECLNYLAGDIKVNRDNRKQYEKAIKLEQAMDVYKSDMIEVRKLYELYKLFKDSKHLEATYRIFEKYREDKLIRPYCEQVEELCEYLRRAEERDMVSTAVELVENEDRIDNFEIAKAVAEKYIKESNDFDSDFFACNQLSREEFEYYKDIVKEYDRFTYQLLHEKEMEHLRARKYDTRRKIREMYDGIVNGKTREGYPFDELEFYNALPFRDDRNLAELLEDFQCKGAPTQEAKFKKLVETVEPEKASTIYSYMIEHKIVLKANLMMSHSDIKRENVIRNGKQITEQDKDVIIRYLNARNTPLYTKAVSILRNKVIDGVITLDKDKQLSMHI